MEIRGTQKIKELIQKIGTVRLVILVLAGILLLILSFPSGNSTSTEEAEVDEETVSTDEIALDAMQKYAKNQEAETEEILSKVEGIGDVKVMLTLASSEERITLQDNDVTQDDSQEEDHTGGSRTEEKYESSQENVLVESGGEKSPYVVQINSPAIEGVLVVAKGIDSSKKEREIIEAIQALFPIETHKIKVMKME